MNKKSSNFTIRYSEPSDAPYISKWLEEPGILRWFPCQEKPEVEDTVRMLIGFGKWKCSLTAVLDEKPIGIAILFLHAYKKIAHQCLFGVILDKEHRNKGYGSTLINNLIHLAKTQFNIEVLHLEVFEENPAISLYRRMGFTESGYQKYWIKEDNGKYRAKITMEKFIK